MRILLVLMGLTLLYSCNNTASSFVASYEQTKTNLEEKETTEPSQFLSVNGRYWKNWIGQWVCEGNITNMASAASYKDVVLKVVYYSKTNSELGSEEKTVFEYFKPNSSQHFKIKVNDIEGTSFIKVTVLSASSGQ